MSPGLTGMSPRLAFFTLKHFSGAVFVTRETTVLRRAVAYWRWSGRDRAGRL